VLRHADGFDSRRRRACVPARHGPSIGVLPFVLWIVILIAGTSNG